MKRRRGTLALLAGLSMAWLVAGEAFAQTPAPSRVPREADQPVLPPLLPLPGPYPAPIPGPPALPVPGARPDPLLRELESGRFVIRPSFTLSEEYNDNIFADNRNKQSDFITSFTPGVLVGFRGENYSISGGYSFTSEIYADESNLNDAFARQVATLDATYRFDPRLLARLTERYSRDNNTSFSAVPGVSTGRRESWTNVVAPGLEWDVDPLTRLRVGGSWERTRFLDRESGDDFDDYDIYRVLTGLERRLTPRLTGLADYEFAYGDTRGADDTATHLLRVGGRYQVTETLLAWLAAGPQYTSEGDVGWGVAVSAGLSQRFSWGFAALSYDRRDAVVGGVGGSAETDAVSATVQADITRDFSMGLTASYTRLRDGRRIDTDAFNIGLSAAYRITTWMSAIGSYNFFWQRSSGTDIVTDVDQNRVLLGLQFSYPIRMQ